MPKNYGERKSRRTLDHIARPTPLGHRKQVKSLKIQSRSLGSAESDFNRLSACRSLAGPANQLAVFHGSAIGLRGSGSRGWRKESVQLAVFVQSRAAVYADATLWTLATRAEYRLHNTSRAASRCASGSPARGHHGKSASGSSEAGAGMHPSMFNVRVPLNDRDDVFLMNTFTDAQLIVSRDVAELLDRVGRRCPAADLDARARATRTPCSRRTASSSRAARPIAATSRTLHNFRDDTAISSA